MSFCPFCGSEITENAKFCSKCGKSFSDDSTLTGHKKRINSLIPLVIALILLLVIVFAVLKPRSFADNPNSIEQKSQSVVLLECFDQSGELYCTGSAFALYDDGIFVTNYHVVAQEVYQIIAHTETGLMFEIDSVLAFDKEQDIAILKTLANTGICPLTIGSSEELEKGEKVVAIGSPLGFINSVSIGVFSGYIHDGSNDFLQFNASISHGSSGGVLFNNQGDVIGITCGSYEGSQNLNVAVPIRCVDAVYTAANTPVTISQFYDSFDHYTLYTVDEVCHYSKSAPDNMACIIGYVAEISDKQCLLVSSKDEVYDYLAGMHNMNSLQLIDVKVKPDIFINYHVGDCLKIKTSIQANYANTSGLGFIFIRNSENVSLADLK